MGASPKLWGFRVSSFGFGASGSEDVQPVVVVAVAVGWNRGPSSLHMSELPAGYNPKETKL